MPKVTLILSFAQKSKLQPQPLSHSELILNLSAADFQLIQKGVQTQKRSNKVHRL